MMNELSSLPAEQTFSNVTFYFKQDMAIGITRVDAKTLKIEVGRYAQYERAIQLTWIGKGQRRERCLFVSAYHPFFVLVDRKDAIDLDSIFDPATRQINSSGTVITKGRYSSCDSRWQSDFTAKLEDAGVDPIIMIDEMGKVRDYA